MQSIKSSHFRLQHLLSLKSLQLVKKGSAEFAEGVAPEEAPRSGHIVLCSDPRSFSGILDHSVAALITNTKSGAIAQGLAEAHPATWVFASPAIALTMTELLPLFDKRELPAGGVDPQASVHPTAQWGKNTFIGPFVRIGANAVLGDHCILDASISIGQGVKIGSGTRLHAGVVIEDFCEIGERVEIHANTTIGSDGFGFAENPERKGHFLKIPQIGIVVIEDDVEIGANCAIDRATLSETRIGRGSKLDNLIHIAHNCVVGEGSRLAGGTMLAGSVKAGAHLLTGGGVLISDHVTVTHHVAIAGRSGVTKDITAPGAYGGYPLEPLRDSLKSIANIAKLTSMRKQLAQVRKHLGLETSQE